MDVATMLLLDKPLHRTFPTDERHKITFKSDDANVVIPPLYVFVDNRSGWNIDTRFLAPPLHDTIADMFALLYDRHFDVLTVEKILEEATSPQAIHTQYARLSRGPTRPSIIVKYYDLHVVYRIPGRRVSASTLIKCEDIPRDLCEDTSS